MNDSVSSAAREAVAVAQAALALSGHTIDEYTYELITKMGRGELTGDQAVEALLTRFIGSCRRGEP